MDYRMRSAPCNTTLSLTPDFEFGMTQAFLAQTEGTSSTQMARKPQNRGLLGFGDPQLQKL